MTQSQEIVVYDAMNDVVMSGIDQFLPMQKQQKQLLERVDLIIEQSIADGTPRKAAEALKALNGFSRLSGMASSKFIYNLSNVWSKFPESKHTSIEAWAEDNLGYTATTVKRYYNTWEMLISNDIPKEYTEKMKLMPMRCLVPISTMWKQQWDVTDQQWLKLSNAPDPTTVNKIIREVKGKEPKEGSLQLEMEPDGTLFAWKNGKKFNVGYLNVDSEDEEVHAAIERILSDKILRK